MMRNLIGTALLVALLGSRTAAAENSALAKAPAAPARVIDRSELDQRLAGRAPIGHRQPQPRDVPSEQNGDIERIGDEDRALDRKLVICRGC
jgi:hypothetical protein